MIEFFVIVTGVLEEKGVLPMTSHYLIVFVFVFTASLIGKNCIVRFPA